MEKNLTEDQQIFINALMEEDKAKIIDEFINLSMKYAESEKDLMLLAVTLSKILMKVGLMDENLILQTEMGKMIGAVSRIVTKAAMPGDGIKREFAFIEELAPFWEKRKNQFIEIIKQSK